jgi:hypothetical protein
MGDTSSTPEGSKKLYTKENKELNKLISTSKVALVLLKK